MAEIFPPTAQVSAGGDAGRNDNAVAKIKIGKHPSISEARRVSRCGNTGKGLEKPPPISAAILNPELSSICVVKQIIIPGANGQE